MLSKNVGSSILILQFYLNLNFFYLRIVGKNDDWSAITLTFYSQRNFKGTDEKMLDENADGIDDIPFKPE